MSVKISFNAPGVSKGTAKAKAPAKAKAAPAKKNAVSAAPTFVEKLQDAEVTEGKTAKLECVVSGDPEPDIDWLFEGQRVKEGGRFKFIFGKNDECALEISKVTVDDEGFYECVAKNKSGKATSKCELLVNAPGKILSAPESATVKKGGTATFKCKYDGNPRPDVKWFKGSKQIKDADKYVLTNKSQVATLEIDDVGPEDEGDYKIVVGNEYGDTSETFTLSIPGSKPGASDANGPGKTLFQQQSEGRVYVPPTRKKKKSKLPIERDAIIHGNPEAVYEFGEEIGRGKFSVVRKCVKKDTGEEYAAKIIKFDEETVKFAVREYDLMVSGRLNHKGLVQLHEAYIVRKYLVLIMELAAGQTLLTYMSKRHSLTEDDVAQIIRQLLEILEYLHGNNVIHNDIRPTNIRMAAIGSRDVKLLDYNSARHIANKMAGEVVDVIGDTEFCAPELLAFEPVLPMSDMWSLGVIMYILLSGISPFFDPDEEEVLAAVQSVSWEFDGRTFERVTTEAKDFIQKLFIRVPEMRMSASEALKHPWLSATFSRARKNSQIRPQQMKETDKRLYSEEEEEYIEASLVFRTFDEEEYESPEEDDDEEEEEE